jgi:parvulin-like peptidyl-prolyl isomerase
VKNVKVMPLPSFNGTSFAVTCSLGLILSLTACSKTGEKTETSKTDTSTSTGTSTSTSSSTTTTTTTTPDKAAEPTKDAPAKASEDTSTSTTPAPTAADGKAAPSAAKGINDDMPQVTAASQLLNLQSLPDSKVLCTVNGTPITAADFKHEFKLREEQTQAMLSMQPDIETQLLDDAKLNKVTLTDVEKQRLLESAKKAESGKVDALRKYLKDNKISPAQFDEKVLSIGLALKDAAQQTKKTLLPELVDQQILIQFARSKGYAQKAFNKYMELKRTPQYKNFLNQSGFSPDDAQTQLVNRQLMVMAVEDVKKTTPQPTDKELQQVYDLNKATLKHGERIRLSQIIIAAPEKDLPDQASLRTQISKQEPALKGAALDAKVKEQDEVQKNKAQAILEEIQKGGDFAKIANEKSDDTVAKQAKSGGDIGYKDVTLLVKEFANKVKGVKVGDVVPEVVKTEFGYHVVKVTGREPAGAVPLAEVKDEITNQLMQRKNLQTVIEFLAKQHKSSQIKLAPDLQAMVAADAKSSGGTKTN